MSDSHTAPSAANDAEHPPGDARLIAAVTAVTAAWLGGRHGRKWPIVLGLGLNVAAAVGIALTEGPTSYAIFLLMWNTAYYFVVPFLMGAMAAMDDLGRWVVAADGAWTLGDAVGPALAGHLVEWGGHETLAVLAGVVGVSCMAMVLGVLHRFESRPPRPGVDPPPLESPPGDLPPGDSE